jgi:hypothetical protein
MTYWNELFNLPMVLERVTLLSVHGGRGHGLEGLCWELFNHQSFHRFLIKPKRIRILRAANLVSPLACLGYAEAGWMKSVPLPTSENFWQRRNHS